MNRQRIDFANSFDRYVQIVSFAVNNKRRIDSKSVADLTGSCRRSAQRYLAQLEEAGYLFSDKTSPKGFPPTEKANLFFGLTNEND